MSLKKLAADNASKDCENPEEMSREKIIKKILEMMSE